MDHCRPTVSATVGALPDTKKCFGARPREDPYPANACGRRIDFIQPQ
jgi:hypothetical protein